MYSQQDANLICATVEEARTAGLQWKKVLQRVKKVIKYRGGLPSLKQFVKTHSHLPVSHPMTLSAKIKDAKAACGWLQKTFGNNATLWDIYEKYIKIAKDEFQKNTGRPMGRNKWYSAGIDKQVADELNATSPYVINWRALSDFRRSCNKKGYQRRKSILEQNQRLDEVISSCKNTAINPQIIETPVIPVPVKVPIGTSSRLEELAHQLSELDKQREAIIIEMRKLAQYW